MKQGDVTDPVESTKVRGSSPDKPFCWQEKPTLRRIRKELADASPGIALAVYFALTEQASNEESSEFVASQEDLARLAGVSTKTVERGLKLLEAIQVVRIEPQFLPGTKIRARSKYAILTDTTVSRSVATVRNPTVESEHIEEHLEETVEEPKKRGRTRFKKPSIDEFKDYASEIDLSHAEAEKAFDYYEASGWFIGGGKPMKDWRAALRNWQRRGKSEFKQQGKQGPVQPVYEGRF